MKISEIVLEVKSGKTSARAFVERALKKARDIEEYHALLSLTKDRALTRADEIDDLVSKGQGVGKLAGVPFVVKDNYLAFGAPSTAASKILQNFNTPLQARTTQP